MVFLFLPDLLHLVSSSLGPSVLLQVALFHSFLWLIVHCIYVPHLLIHSSVDEHLGCFHSWLLQTVLLWALGCMYRFILVSYGYIHTHTHIHIYVHICIYVCVCVYMYIYTYITRSGVAGSYGNCIFSFLRGLHTVFTKCTLLSKSETRPEWLNSKVLPRVHLFPFLPLRVRPLFSEACCVLIERWYGVGKITD